MAPWPKLALAALLAAAPAAAADRPHPYAITPKAGKYCILVKAYTGNSAGQYATSMVSELRRDYRLPAYFFNRTGKEQSRRRRQKDEYLTKLQKAYDSLNVPLHSTKIRIPVAPIKDEYAILIGGFDSMEAARDYLKKKLRKMKPPSKELLDRVNRTAGKTLMNPFLSAFVVPNPTADVNHKVQERLPARPVWKKLNANEPYSVLRVPKPWTLVVRVYKGAATLSLPNQSKQWVGRGYDPTNQHRYRLVCAAQAHKMAKMLRAMKEYPVDSYVLHTEHMSVLCVGQFDSHDDPRMKMEPYSKLRGMKVRDKNSGKLYDQLLDEPLPMAVPRFKD